MSRWEFVDLTFASTWDPVRVLSPILVAVVPDWRGTQVPLGDLGAWGAKTEAMGPGMAVVAPSGLDDNGRINTTSSSSGSAAYAVGDDGIRFGDLLVAAGKPCILIGPGHQGLRFSRAFQVFRASERDAVDPMWMWALLSSRRGIEARRLLADLSPNQPDSLRQLLVPVPAYSDWTPETHQRVAELHQKTLEGLSDLERGSHWSRVELDNFGDWLDAVIGYQPAQSGVPLRDLTEFVRQGQHTVRVRELLVEEPTRDSLPFVNGKDVVRRYEPSRWWPNPDPDVVARPGDLLIPRIGEAIKVQIVDAPVVPSESLWWLRPAPILTPQHLAATLLSPPVARQLNVARGRRGTIPTLLKKHLDALRVPEQTLVDAGTEHRPLPELLDELVP